MAKYDQGGGCACGLKLICTCVGVTQGTPAAPTDTVENQTHYARWKMQPIEFIAINDMPWWMANVIKYIMRYDAKDGLKDMYKAQSYLNSKIMELEGKPRFWEKPVAEERKLNGA